MVVVPESWFWFLVDKPVLYSSSRVHKPTGLLVLGPGKRKGPKEKSRFAYAKLLIILHPWVGCLVYN